MTSPHPPPTARTARLWLPWQLRGPVPFIRGRVGGGWGQLTVRSLVMATATATAPTDLAEQPAADPQPAPAAVPGPLARILAPVEPARAVQPLGTTASMGQPAEDAVASKGGTGKGGTAKGSDRDGAVAALVRALAARIGRTGTTTKRSHQVTETRVSGASSTNTSKADRTAKHDGQHRTSRDAKLADLNSKTAQQHGKTSSDTKTGTAGATTANAKTPKPDRSAKPGDTHTKTASSPDARPATTKTAKADPAAKTDSPAKPDTSPRPAAATPAKTADPKGLNTKTAPAPKPTVTPKGTTTSTLTGTTKPAAKYRTQPARDAGYRDGTRAATVAGHAKAYRDGTKDGWHDRAAADHAEAKAMDEARTRNAIKPQAPEAPKMTPATGTTADMVKKPAPAEPAAPVQVTAVGEKAIGFTGADGTSHTMSRGEVRTLKAFERSMADKRTRLGRIQDGSKITSRLAVDMAARAQALAEDAKAVKGGPVLVGLLNRLAERAQALRIRAEEIQRSAHLGSEAVAVLVANADTRHGGIYRAVVDSPLTAPAEREFYLDKDGK